MLCYWWHAAAHLQKMYVGGRAPGHMVGLHAQGNGDAIWSLVTSLGHTRSLTRFQQSPRLRVALADISCPVAAYTQWVFTRWLLPSGYLPGMQCFCRGDYNFPPQKSWWKQMLSCRRLFTQVICSLQEQPPCTSTITRRLTVQMAHITESYLQPNFSSPKSRRD